MGEIVGSDTGLALREKVHHWDGMEEHERLSLLEIMQDMKESEDLEYGFSLQQVSKLAMAVSRYLHVKIEQEFWQRSI